MLYVAWKENMFGIPDITESVINFAIGKLNSVIQLINSISEYSNRAFGTSIGKIGTVSS